MLDKIGDLHLTGPIAGRIAGAVLGMVGGWQAGRLLCFFFYGRPYAAEPSAFFRGGKFAELLSAFSVTGALLSLLAGIVIATLLARWFQDNKGPGTSYSRRIQSPEED